jgi:predicted lipoprotein with Yx(FWY)xxD motif
MHAPQKGTVRTLALLCAAVFALAMFGVGTAGAATPATQKAKSKATTVKVATIPGVGAVLVNPDGHALYTLTDANGAAVACTDACLSAWPAYTVSATAKVAAPKGVKNLTATSDTHQVAWKGLPLYTFVKDTAPKTASGNGLQSFGGTWNVVKVTNTTAATNPAPTTKSSGGSYSGY